MAPFTRRRLRTHQNFVSFAVNLFHTGRVTFPHLHQVNTVTCQETTQHALTCTETRHTRAAFSVFRAWEEGKAGVGRRLLRKVLL